MYLLVFLNASWYAFSQLLINRNDNKSLYTFFLGMLPLPGFSTFDLEEELEELRKKLQIMEGE